MTGKEHFNEVPKTGTFWLLSILTGSARFSGSSQRNAGTFPSARGNELEVFALSVMAGLAVLGVTGGILMDYLGPWGLIAAFPAWGIVLHVFGFACAGIGEFLQWARVLRPAWREAFNGIAFGLAVAAAALLKLQLGEPLAWLTLPWLGFIAIECLIWPTRRMLEPSGERE